MWIMEGVYTYLCENCPTLFGVVSRFSVMEDKVEILTCPKCSKKVAACIGEGHLFVLFNQIEDSNFNKIGFIEFLLVCEAIQQSPNFLIYDNRLPYLCAFF